eukprot:EG_transcript_29844
MTSPLPIGALVIKVQEQQTRQETKAPIETKAPTEAKAPKEAGPSTRPSCTKSTAASTARPQAAPAAVATGSKSTNQEFAMPKTGNGATEDNSMNSSSTIDSRRQVASSQWQPVSRKGKPGKPWTRPKPWTSDMINGSKGVTISAAFDNHITSENQISGE